MVLGRIRTTRPTIGIRSRFTVTPIYRQHSRSEFSLARAAEFRITIGDGRTRTGTVTTSTSTSATITLRIGRNTLTGGVMGSGRTYPNIATALRIETTAPAIDT